MLASQQLTNNTKFSFLKSYTSYGQQQQMDSLSLHGLAERQLKPHRISNSSDNNIK